MRVTNTCNSRYIHLMNVWTNKNVYEEEMSKEVVASEMATDDNLIGQEGLHKAQQHLSLPYPVKRKSGNFYFFKLHFSRFDFPAVWYKLKRKIWLSFWCWNDINQHISHISWSLFADGMEACTSSFGATSWCGSFFTMQSTSATATGWIQSSKSKYCSTEIINLTYIPTTTWILGSKIVCFNNHWLKTTPTTTGVS